MKESKNMPQWLRLRTAVYSLLLAGILALAGISFMNQNASADATSTDATMEIFLPFVSAEAEGGTIPTPN